MNVTDMKYLYDAENVCLQQFYCYAFDPGLAITDQETKPNSRM